MNSFDIMAISITAAYFIAIAIISIFGARRTKTISDFISASGQLGFWTYVLLMIGSVTSGMTIIGVAGLGFQSGWANLWERVIGPPFAISFCTLLIGYKMWSLRKKFQILTMQDYLAVRYEDPKWMRVLAGLISAVTCFAYLIGQYTAIGVVSEVVLGVPYSMASFIALIVVLGYVVSGGMFSTAWTTLLQALIMIVIAIVMAPMIIGWVGGWIALNELASQVPILQKMVRGVSEAYAFAQFLDKPFGPAEMPLVGWAYNLTLFGLTVPLGLMVAPHIVNNVLCFKDPKYTKWGPILMYSLSVPIIMATSLIGLAARVAWAQGRLSISSLKLEGGVVVAWNDMAFPTIAKAALPYGIFILLLPCVLAAVMSTTDRLLVTAASNISYDIVKKVIRPNLSDNALKWISRIVIIIIGVTSWWLSLTPQPMLAWFIWAALSIMVSCFFWPIIGGLYWRRMNKHAARWGMLAGFITTLISFWIWGRNIIIPGVVALYAVVPGFIASTAVTLILSFITKPHSEGLLKETLTGRFIRAD
ncbi:MAG: sodium:solute symporter [Candidatus Methanomethyliaceae archaeon]|nr:sodium:solute symporter [Candidatus Methanomethyliaceae archaeon]MDW7971074.1 sodium:solute symporter [Nitrososphaerota archaeon]